MNENIMGLKEKLSILDRLQESHFELVEKVGADNIPDKLPVRGELGDCFTVRHSHVKYMDTYTLDAFEKSAVVSIISLDNSITFSEWDEDKEHCIASMRVRLGASEDHFSEMMKYTGSVTAGTHALFLIRNAIQSFPEGME